MYYGSAHVKMIPCFHAGGLLVDLEVLSIKPSSIPGAFYPNKGSPIPKLPPSHPAIVEWRAMTVIELYVRIPSDPVQPSHRVASVESLCACRSIGRCLHGSLTSSLSIFFFIWANMCR